MAILRSLFDTLGGVLFGLPLAAGMLFGLAQSEGGREWIARAVAEVLSTPGSRVTITGLSGLVPFDIGIEKIAIEDTIAIDHTRATLRPLDLMAARLTFDRLTADTVRITPSDSGTDEQTTFLRLRLPFPVTVVHLAIGALRVGTSPEIAVSGAAQFDGMLSLTASLDTKLEEHPLNLTIAGKGTFDDWRGKAVLKWGNDASLDTGFRLSARKHASLALEGSAHPGALLPAELSPPLGPDLPFVGKISLEPSRAIAIDGLRVTLPSGDL
ncbi:MAG TPA: hypothetical protein VKT70_09015, partial [Stellaceae bacterium]|nr:hypothetical protein [Stellaceae bacterium]